MMKMINHDNLINWNGYKLTKDQYEHLKETNYIAYPYSDNIEIVKEKIKASVLLSLQMIDNILNECDYETETTSHDLKDVFNQYFSSQFVLGSLDNNVVLIEQYRELCNSINNELKQLIVANIIYNSIDSINLISLELSH
jgi:hypothetical protein